MRYALERIRPAAPGRRALKTALAVGLAWWLATIFGEPRPLFAALGAMVGMEATVAGSLRRILLTLTGMVGGLGLAFAVSHLLGATPLAIGLVVLLGLWLGARLGSPDRIGVELGVTSLVIVVFAAGDPAYGLTRIWETVLGGLTAATVNALVWPPDYLDRVRDDLDRVVTAAAVGLRQATRIFVERPGHEGIDAVSKRVREARATLPDVQATLQRARSALRWSPLVRRHTAALDRYTAAADLYAKAIGHAVTLARMVEQHAERPHPWQHDRRAGAIQLVEGAEALSLALERYAAYVDTGTVSLLPDVQRAHDRAAAALAAGRTLAEEARLVDVPLQRLVDLGSVAGELEHLTGDLAAALDLLPLGGVHVSVPS